ncbi:MAG TPA: hypothetical protein VFF27_09140 [Bacteroidia bacterium]|jgi:hypothetical protein|nr:hypothetical protein [Bacteroidia bacterium]
MKKRKKINLKFKSDNTPLSDTQINKHKNFTTLMHEYQKGTTPLYKTPLYKNKKVFLVLLLILLVLFLVVEVLEKEEKQDSTPANTTQNK